MALAPVGIGFTDVEVEQLKTAGASVLGNNRARTGVISGEIVTTYKTDNAGNPDASYKFLNTVDTVSLIREYFWNNFKQRFAQSRLTLGALVEGRPMANASAVFTYCTKLYNDLSESGFVLTQAGGVATKAFKDNLVISIDMQKGLVTVEANVVPIVGQYRETFGKIKFSFNPSAA
jgi:phage tail sheath gpL-like